MAAIYAVDPGTAESALIVMEHPKKRITGRHIAANEEILAMLSAHVQKEDMVAVEMVACYGMPVGMETFLTVLWIGRFVQALHPHPVRLITRNEVKMALCHQIKGVNDAVIRQRLIDIFGPSQAVAKGTKQTPGPLYGVTTHLWSALAVAVAALETTTSPGVTS
jgi:hypothetical protein